MRNKLKRYHDHLAASIDEVLNSDWEHFQQIVFLESTPETELFISSPLDEGDIKPPVPKKLKVFNKATRKLHCTPPPQNPLNHPLPHNQVLVKQKNLKIILQTM